MSLLSGLFRRRRDREDEAIEAGLTSWKPDQTAGSIKIAPALPADLFARAGDWIVCDGAGQHAIACFKQDVKVGDMFVPGLMADWKQPEPPLGTSAENIRCTICGGWWFRGDGHFHFKDGWR